MISKKDVVKMFLPHPDMNAQLAKDSHMYICMEDGSKKEFIKCQKFKPAHKIRSIPPYNCLIENTDIARNPFRLKTTIDCDKSFIVESVQVDARLLATDRKNVSDQLFAEVKKATDHSRFTNDIINSDDLCLINRLITKVE